MKRWVNIRDGLPECETECLLAVKRMGTIVTHKKLAEWDGYEWIDVDGEAVKDVELWMEAPKAEPETIINKLILCVENDKCENRDCCYFVTLDELEALLKYIKE